jgi:hypothetical protein
MRRILLAAAIVSMLAGCHYDSGRVGQVQISDDGKVLAFDDMIHPGAFVADADGVRRVAGRADLRLSRDGRWLLVVEGTDRYAAAYHAGQRLRLRELATGREHRLRLPRMSAANGDGPLVHRRGGEVYFAPGPTLTIRMEPPLPDWRDPLLVPERPDGHYMQWSPEAGWSPLSPDRIDVVRDGHVPAAELVRKEVAPLVTFPPTPAGRLTRTVWVRPDGSTLLLREQDRVEPDLLEMALLFPFFFWSEYYWLGWTERAEEIEPRDAAPADARLARLIAERRR